MIYLPRSGDLFGHSSEFRRSLTARAGVLPTQAIPKLVEDREVFTGHCKLSFRQADGQRDRDG
jgi:hypothetical protein